MLRILAIVTFVVALTLGQSGRLPAEVVPTPADGFVILALANTPPHGGAEHEKETCPPFHACCHAACSPTLAMVSGDIVLRNNAGSMVGLQLKDRSLRSILLNRDPPVPRPLV